MTANGIRVKYNKDDIVKSAGMSCRRVYEDPPQIGLLKINMSSLITICHCQSAAQWLKFTVFNVIELILDGLQTRLQMVLIT
jgi:hypothetical protein